jgi:hypothetical protein
MTSFSVVTSLLPAIVQRGHCVSGKWTTGPGCHAENGLLVRIVTLRMEYWSRMSRWEWNTGPGCHAENGLLVRDVTRRMDYWSGMSRGEWTTGPRCHAENDKMLIVKVGLRFLLHLLNVPSVCYNCCKWTYVCIYIILTYFVSILITTATMPQTTKCHVKWNMYKVDTSNIDGV